MTTLLRTLTLRDVTLLVIGSVIGSGIFLVPGTVLRQVEGHVGWALLAWVVAGLLSLVGALTYGELSARDPKAGGLYVFLREAFGPLPAFLYGWTLFFAIASGAVATLAVAFSGYAHEIFSFSPALSKAVALAMIVVLAAVNVRGTRSSADVQNWTTALKVGALVLMSGILFRFGSGWAELKMNFWSSSSSVSLASGFGLAMIGVLWAYEGWQFCTFSAGETHDPQRTFPRAFLIGSTALIAIYVVANLAYLVALGPLRMARSQSIATDAVSAVIGPTAAVLVTLAILVSIFSAANSVILTASRVFYAMARDGLFFRRLAEVHPRFHTPAASVLALSGWAALLALSGTFEQLLTYVIFSGWIFYGLGAASLFIYRKRRSDASCPYRVPGYPWTPLIFILAAALLVGNTIATQPVRAAMGLGIVFLGTPAYLLWRRRTAPVSADAPSS
ncbi:MAG TPA: amino acid permease [Blastocatellia bacterium]|nr:amino acid permease [Blastocatellia bacterium]